MYSFFACLPNVYSFSENLLVFFYKYLLFSDTFDISDLNKVYMLTI